MCPLIPTHGALFIFHAVFTAVPDLQGDAAASARIYAGAEFPFESFETLLLKLSI